MRSKLFQTVPEQLMISSGISTTDQTPAVQRWDCVVTIVAGPIYYFAVNARITHSAVP